MSTAEHTDALTRRIEQLAAAALDEGDGAALAALIAALRSEIGAVRVDVGSLRSETGGLRTDLDGLEGRLVASVDAGKRETTSLLRRFAGELDETVTSAMDEAARSSTAASSSLEDARGALESRLAVLEDALDGLSERLEALARDGAVTTSASLQQLTATVRELDARLTAQSAASADDVVDRLGELLATRLAASEQRMTELLHEARARAEEDRAAAERVAATAEARLGSLDEAVDRSLSELRVTAGQQHESVLALTGRLGDLGDQLAGRLSELSTVVDSATSRLGGDVTERLDVLEATMGRFREEWPTRTFEVVQGAKAVAEGVTREVRAQVELQLERVRDELAGVVATIHDARDGLDAQGGRLAEAGKVLVTYLEQRDRMLEDDRDRVLHDVLDSFAAGLSSRERSALATRMGDAVARRRDARDGERYRAAAASSQPPARTGLPPELELLDADTVVRGLAGRTPRTGTAGPPPGMAERRRSVHPPSAARGALPSATSVVPPPSQLRPQPAPAASHVRAVPSRPAQAPVEQPAGAPGRVAAVTPAPVKRPAGAPGSPGGSKEAADAGGKAVQESAGKATGKAAGRASAGKAGLGRTGGQRRGRREAMPEVAGVDVALEPDPRPPQDPPQPRPEPQARPAPPEADVTERDPDEDDGVRRLFRRRPRP